MRKIKFRAWIVDEEKYYHNVQNTYDYIDWFNTGDEPAPFVCFGHMLNDKNIIIEQYTGIPDKNKKEICEGDIVKMDGLYYLIKWDDEGGKWCMSLERDWMDYLFLTKKKAPFMEIIGNIHENGELLK